MITMGDEVRRTQRGNNNAYCQDNETSWFDWTLLSRHADVRRFVRLLIARRLRRDVNAERQRLSLNEFLRASKHAWHGVKLGQPDWSPGSHTLVLDAEISEGSFRFHLILNAYWDSLDFELPELGGGDTWGRWIDTALDTPNDIVDWQEFGFRSPAKHTERGPCSVVGIGRRLRI